MFGPMLPSLLALVSLNVTYYREVPGGTIETLYEKALFLCTSGQFRKIHKKKKKKVFQTIKTHKILRVGPKKSLKDIKKIIEGKPSRGDVDNLEKLQYHADIHLDVTTQHAHSLSNQES